MPRLISGVVTLECSANPKHVWDEKYSVAADENGNPNVGLLTSLLRQRKLSCPNCGYLSYRMIKIVVSAIRY